MRLCRLRLVNFRNYADSSFEFSPGLNAFIGDNAQGKTNLLEAITFLITGRSFRTSRLPDLIREGQAFFRLEANFLKHGVMQTLVAAFNGQRKELRHNETRLSAFSQLLGILHGVLSAPEDHELVAGGPAHRRRFLDIHLAQLDSLYLHHLLRFYRALKQRNQLLRTHQTEGMEAWEEQLSIASAYLTSQRLKSVEEIGPKARLIQEQLSSGSDALTLTLKPSAEPTIEAYRAAYKRQRDREMSLGYTLVGAHREELLLQIGEREARLFGSQGQCATTALSLRLAEWERVASETSEPPLLLLDDIGAHLSPQRRVCLQEYLLGAGQTFVTSTEPLADSGAKLFSIHGGTAAVGEEVSQLN